MWFGVLCCVPCACVLCRCAVGGNGAPWTIPPPAILSFTEMPPCPRQHNRHTLQLRSRAAPDNGDLFFGEYRKQAVKLMGRKNAVGGCEADSSLYSICRAALSLKNAIAPQQEVGCTLELFDPQSKH